MQAQHSESVILNPTLTAARSPTPLDSSETKLSSRSPLIIAVYCFVLLLSPSVVIQIPGPRLSSCANE